MPIVKVVECEQPIIGGPFYENPIWLCSTILLFDGKFGKDRLTIVYNK